MIEITSQFPRMLIWPAKDLSHLFLSSQFNTFYQKTIDLILNTYGDCKLKLNLHSFIFIAYKNILHVESKIVEVIDTESRMEVTKAQVRGKWGNVG